MFEISLVLTTLPTSELSESISRTLVEEGLVACVSIITGVNSLYIWEGQFCNTKEQILLMKVSRNNLKSLETRLADLHPYKVFEFVALSTESVSQAYAEWVLRSCQSGTDKA